MLTVYQITHNIYNLHYIGNTKRFIHERVREHLNNKNSSNLHVPKHIEIKTILPILGITNLPSTPERNAANSRTYCSNDYFSISRDTLCTMTLAH